MDLLKGITLFTQRAPIPSGRGDKGPKGPESRMASMCIMPTQPTLQNPSEACLRPSPPDTSGCDGLVFCTLSRRLAEEIPWWEEPWERDVPERLHLATTGFQEQGIRSAFMRGDISGCSGWWMDASISRELARVGANVRSFPCPAMLLAFETSCDETSAAVVHRGRVSVQPCFVSDRVARGVWRGGAGVGGASSTCGT